MDKPYRWGIVGPGGIAHRFADALGHFENAKIQAVVSTNSQRAEDFAKKFSVPNYYDNYQHLYADDSVDIVYVATTHNFHCENVVDALKAGKGVLCEKPLAVNASQVRKMIDVSRKNNVFLMEAMWTRFLPMMTEIRQIIDEGGIGMVKLLYADFGVKFKYDPQSRSYNLNLAGGALLDIGVYLISLTSMVFGKPVKISSKVKMAKTGVDERSTILMEYGNSQAAILFLAMDLDTPREVLITGTKGTIKLHGNWMHDMNYSIRLNDGTNKTRHVNTESNRFIYQIKAVHDCLEAGKIQCDIMSPQESLQISQTMDALRKQWNFKYPFE